MRRPPLSILLIGLATALVLPGDSLLYAVLPTYFEQLGLTPIQVGILLSANRWVRLVSNHFAELALRGSRGEAWLLAAFLLGSGVMVVYGATTLFAALLAARLGWGIAFSFMRQAGIMTVVAASDDGNIRQNMGYLRGFMALGGIVGVLLGGLGHDLFGFTPTLLGFFLVSLAAAPMGYFSQRGLPLETGTMARSAAVKAPSGAMNPRLMFGGLVVGMVGPGIISSTLGLVLKSRMEGSIHLAGLAIGAATFSGLVLAFRWTMDGVGAPLLGALSDRLGRERLVAPLFLLGAAAMLMAGLSEGLGGVVAGVMLLFFCGTFLGVLLTAWAALVGPRAVAAYVTAQDFGSAMGPIIGWTIAQFAPKAHSIFLVGAGAYALALLVTGAPLRRKMQT